MDQKKLSDMAPTNEDATYTNTSSNVYDFIGRGGSVNKNRGSSKTWIFIISAFVLTVVTLTSVVAIGLSVHAVSKAGDR